MIAVELPENAEDDLPIFYVPVGTTIQAAYNTESWYKYAEIQDHYHLNDYNLALWSLARPDGTRIYGEELGTLFNTNYYIDYGADVICPFILTQEGLYDFYVEGTGEGAYIYAVAPGGAYDETILAQDNGREAKINVGKATAQSIISYQGQQISIYTVLPGTSSSSWNLQMFQVDGASYVINVYKAKIDNGTLIDIEDNNVWEFEGQEGYFQWFGTGDELEGALVYEFIENGVTIQTVAITLEEVSSAGTYVVQAGDTWSSICTNFYGNNAQRYALMKANGNVGLKVGAVITLPEQLGNATRLPAPVAGEGEKLYTVKLGDTLGSIALAEYGTMSAYKDIFDRNTDRIKNVNMIYEGQVIVLPAR